jgi:hypothetical protein
MKIHISNANNRDATVIATSTSVKEKTIPSKAGKPVLFQRYVAAGEGKIHEALAKEYGDSYSKQLIEADPEIDLEMVGRTIDGTNTVLLDKDGQPLFCAPAGQGTSRCLQHRCCSSRSQQAWHDL